MAETNETLPDGTGRLIGRSLFSAWRAVMSITVLGAFTGFAASTLTARVLGAEGFGTLAIATNLLAILIVLAGAGYQLALLRFGPKFLAERDGIRFRAMVRSARMQTLAFSVIAVAATAVCILLFPRFAQLGRADVMTVTILALPFAMWTMINTVVNRSYGHLQLAILPDAIMRHLFFIFTAGAFMLLRPGTRQDALYFAVAMVLAAIVSGLLSQEIVRRSTPAFVRNAQPEPDGTKWFKTALSFSGINALFVIRTQIDVFVVAALVSTKEAGIYAVTLRLGDILSTLTTTLSYVISPRISGALAQNNKTLFEQDQKTAAMIMAFFGVMIGIPLIIGAHFWLGIFGPEFQTGVYALVIFALSAMIRNFIGPYFYILTMTDHQGTITRLTTVSVFLQVIMLVSLTGRYGAAGAAFARAVPDVAVAMIGWFIVWRRLGFMTGLPTLFFRQTQALSGTVRGGKEETCPEE